MTTIVFNIEESQIKEDDLFLDVCLNKQAFFDREHDTIIAQTRDYIKSSKFLYPPLDNGLLGTIFKAYSCHVPLSLRPDDIWLSIIIMAST